jgi:NADH dehydrogenase
MRVAITGGTGFVGSKLAERLRADGHEVVSIGRRAGVDVTDGQALRDALAGCQAVAHLAGINRELGSQTYRRVHVDGTRAVVEAARATGVARIVVLSFLRARPDGPSRYHTTKWAAEQIVRDSGLTATVLKSGVIYGPGDHMLDHISRALVTLPVFSTVGLTDRPFRPVAVADVVTLLAAAVVGDPRLADRTIAVVGPEELALRDAVRRIARVMGRRTLIIPAPVVAHRLLARLLEAVMIVPLVARAQVEILAEGATEVAPAAEPPPPDLAPRTPFDEAAIRAGIGVPRRFGRSDLKWPWQTL